MKIQVARVPDEGIQMEATYDSAALNMALEGAQPATPVSVSAFVRKEERELLVQATVRCVLECTCARCLMCFELVIKKDCLFNYDVSARQVVDITDEVREELMLDYPMVPVCQDSCRGLCARCGQNLNDGECTHSMGVEEESGPGVGAE